ncbi:MAG: nucleotide exchange factor GrpE [Candidatus Zixiibacteriota bacterium]|nr:MAG: nucleotide exchange factor GrpE [candidate division Zixibacteria bacterium]
MPFRINCEDFMGDSKEKKEKDVVNEDTKAEKEEIAGEDTEEKPDDNLETEPEPEEKTPEQIIEDLKAEIKEQEDRYLRLFAEFDNYKKRNARLYESLVQSARENFVLPLLEVVDNFERALESSDNPDPKRFQEGTRLIYQQLKELLKKEGVEPIEAVGREFNPNLHEAMIQVESDEYPEGIIVEEMTRGYKLKEKVIRFSRVAVSKGQAGQGNT